MRVRLALILAVVLSLAGAAPAQAAPAAPLVTMTYNVCGNVCRHGEVAGTAGNVAYQARSHHASIVLLQELCYAQFVGVRDRLARAGYQGVFAATTEGGHCADHDRRHGKAFGLGLFARGQLSSPVRRHLPNPSAVRPEPRMMLGASVRVAGRTVFAVTTHTAPSGPNLLAQMAVLSRWLSPIAAQRPVVFGGDLNSMPGNPDLDGFYRSFAEADGARVEPMPTFRTVPRKIDYLFGSKRHLAPAGDTRACNSWSDHCAYFGTFR